MTRIEIHNVGPVTEFEYDLAGPGLHILRGAQGSGKTTILRTVQLATDRRTDTKPTKRDGTPRGEASVAGKTIRIAKQVREEGEIGVEGLGELNISDLHTPKYQDPVTRDKHRIKSLVRLCGVQADASLFHELLADQDFDEIVPADSLSTDDLVEMAARVKRAIEREAIRIEEQEKTERANARAQQQLAEGIDTDCEHDEEALQAQLETALSEKSKLASQRESADEIIGRAREAREKLTELKADGEETRSLEELAAECDGAEELARDAQKRVDNLRAELERAEQGLQAAAQAAIAAQRLYDQAQRNAELTAGWRADIAAAEAVERPSDEQLHQAHQAVESAKAALSRGAEARRGREAQLSAGQHLGQAQRLSERARRLRDAAHDTARVLTEAIARIPGCPLRIRLSESGDPRLVLETDRSDHEAFDELSDGERWPIILQLAAARNRLIVLPQAAYGELSPSTRAQIDALAKEHGCYVLTAVADDGELRGEQFAANDAHARAS